MKRQFFFDHVERDLLRVALESLRGVCGGKYVNDSELRCLKFTGRRIDELLERLKEPEVSA